MWLLPVLAQVSSIATRLFYRLTRVGGSVPKTGAVLLVANHPNSLLDPAMVAVAAGRSVRFLAKSTLFTDPAISWLVRAAGAIPVYRQQDDGAQMGRNEEMFRAVYAALGSGSAVGLFPEGISHSQPSIAPLKTGAARIAFGALSSVAGPFPIIPVGLVFRSKGVFRSRAMIIVGDPVEWNDLAAPTVDAGVAVRELTARIDRAIRRVTVNLEQWEDAPIVEAAESIHAVEYGAARDTGTRVERLRETTRILAKVRSGGQQNWEGLAGQIKNHVARLRRLGLRPTDLQETPRASAAIRWAIGRVPLIGGMIAGVWAVGWVIFWIPYTLTGYLSQKLRPTDDTLSTHKVLIGAALLILWIAIGVTAVWLTAGAIAGIAALVILPALGVLTVQLQERWRGAIQDVRRFFLLRRRQGMIRELRERQRDLAARLEALRLSLFP